MRKCPHEVKIDPYLAGKLSETESVQFEDHYFNCPACFQKTYERNELMTFIQREGNSIFAPVPAPKPAPAKVSLWDRLTALLTPKQWVTAAVTAALLLVVVLGVAPRLHRTAPAFTFNGDATVRGEAVAIVSPSGDIASAPATFSWKAVRGAAEYTVALAAGTETLWTATTAETTVVLPDSVKAKLAAGTTYGWQVKAYAPQGTLLATSAQTTFKIAD
jgi:hypothetical protein